MAAPDADPAGAVAAALADCAGPAVVAVSGGSDSTALLLAAHAVHPDLRAVTLDHGLRPAAADEARRVAARCAVLGVPHVTIPLALPDGPALMARARAARQAALRAHARDAPILLGHTADDVAETAWMRLAHGTGPDGLAAMRGDGPWVRPFLRLRRAALRDWLRARGEPWIEDPSNADPRFERARTRATLVALEGIGPTVGPLADLAHHMRALRDTREDAFRTGLLTRAEERDGTLHVADWSRDLPRTLAAAIGWMTRAPHPPRRAALARAAATLRDGTPTALGGVLARPGPRLHLAREPARTQGPRSTRAAWDHRWHLDGPHDPTLRVARLGRGRHAATPAIWHGDDLVAAPVRDGPGAWRVACDPFARWLTEGGRPR
ncbi:tRNA lysidine(34) synthetase TilS [Jannaschia sp. Os4]|uniref:tRNA lysidine(34) synthetase TilS n=1 Tax=Jannaschia sp. Os4 TaxID=2807617 RepID=UPI001939B588|nr:tRNA lysidine(34) synthetase TilS [Jannaschia sp. Os4]MBM2574739.1 tRNA lysidine(34) synthetase TilS [Jannaschia sp. Os4]